MTHNKRISDKGLEYAIVDTRRMVRDIGQTLEEVEKKLDYMVESWRCYTPYNDGDGARMPDDSYE